MHKIEMAWKAILESRGKCDLQQKTLAKKLGYSTSLVNSALRIPRRTGAIQVFGRGFRLIDYRKLLLIWAVQRDLEGDVIKRLYVNMAVGRIEGEMIHEAAFTGCSRYKFLYGGTPSDYGKVYVYVAEKDVGKVERRYADVVRKAPGGRTPKYNLILLRWDKTLFAEVTLEHLWVDLFNMQDWWAADFRKALDERITLQ